jgi:Ser/Thr protein kinase RdoA (MazF antagonist)
MSSPTKPTAQENLARLILLRKYLEKHYSITITEITRLDRSVYRIDRRDGESWVVRAFPADRPVERVQGDAEILQFLEQHDFPAERTANPAPVTSPGGQGVIVTKFIKGKPAVADESTFFKAGEMLGQLNNLPADSRVIAREADSLHHYSKLEGLPRNDLNAATSWLNTIADRTPLQSQGLREKLLERLGLADDLRDLTRALIHPDPVLKNFIEKPSHELTLIDWTGAGKGPRLLALAILIWNSALAQGTAKGQRVNAAIAGYRSKVKIEDDEFARLYSAMSLRPLIFACWRFKYAVMAGKAPNGAEWWWPSDELTEMIAVNAQAAFKKID